MKEIIKNGLNKIKVLVYGGSFDPPHLAHLAVIDCILHSKQVDQTWVFPCGDRPDKNMMFTPQQRYKMMTDIYIKRPQVQIKDREIKLGKMIPTYTLMKDLQHEHPERQFHFLIGSDLISTLWSWDEGQKLMDEIKFMIIPRVGYQIKREKLRYSQVLDCKILELSSTQIRNIIKDKTKNKHQKLQLLETRVPTQAVELLLMKNML